MSQDQTRKMDRSCSKDHNSAGPGVSGRVVSMKDFDEEYAKRVGEKSFKAILSASFKGGDVHLREPEIYDGVISALAMIHSSLDEIPSADKTHSVSEILARLF